MQMLRNLKDRNIIRGITGVRWCGKSTLLQMFADELLKRELATLLTGRYITTEMLPFSFAEYMKSPKK
jgi:predicted AAA+ superfamily ATPase